MLLPGIDRTDMRLRPGVIESAGDAFPKQMEAIQDEATRAGADFKRMNALAELDARSGLCIPGPLTMC